MILKSRETVYNIIKSREHLSVEGRLKVEFNAALIHAKL